MYYIVRMEAIIKFRSKHNLTQYQLAELLGTTQGGISHIEKSRRNLTIELAKKLTDVSRDLGQELTLDDIFGKPNN